MEKDPKIFLSHILESIEAIEEYTAGISQDEFSGSRQKVDAVTRRIEIIGEATKNLPANFRAANIHIPWKQMTGMRDNLVHEYFGIDYDEVWQTIKEDLPVLKKEIKMLLK
ncbi:hypothetical protein A3D45_00895 [Candidatus Falkowbacteria bacterium RIFCSPHIGHO2_02_FULL_42_9]|uniref:DUF86 domain-containing protein n=1 Tax=Candidatus Falkowbacteria bacterium RIFCSPHIGHO2_02_FULL_42_9 TaxID=1797986 RepID=A0A1F5SB19_9BACT|nr:MAG: hypothetical protein A3D45_00895 [Candidatus Falkowbacteria bacterium RIFCSPHIGHO2_02_FULL_42_9]